MTYIYIYIYISKYIYIYIYILCNHENNVPFPISPQWLRATYEFGHMSNTSFIPAGITCFPVWNRNVAPGKVMRFFKTLEKFLY